MRHKIGTDVKALPEYNFFLLAIVDNSEKSIYCTIKYRYDKKDWIFYCKFSGSKTLTLFPTIIYYPETKSHIMFYISENFQLVNCYSPSNTIKFLEVNSKCNKDLNVLNVTFSSFIFGFYQEKYFRMQLNDPSYAYLECYIPKSIITSTENFIECTLDIEKFPLIVNRKITLPETFPDVNCKIEYWNTINKEIN